MRKISPKVQSERPSKKAFIHTGVIKKEASNHIENNGNNSFESIIDDNDSMKKGEINEEFMILRYLREPTQSYKNNENYFSESTTDKIEDSIKNVANQEEYKRRELTHSSENNEKYSLESTTKKNGDSMENIAFNEEYKILIFLEKPTQSTKKCCTLEKFTCDAELSENDDGATVAQNNVCRIHFEKEESFANTQLSSLENNINLNVPVSLPDPDYENLKINKQEHVDSKDNSLKEVSLESRPSMAKKCISIGTLPLP